MFDAQHSNAQESPFGGPSRRVSHLISVIISPPKNGPSATSAKRKGNSSPNSENEPLLATSQASAHVPKKARPALHFEYKPVDVNSLLEKAKGQRDTAHLHTPKVAAQLKTEHDRLLERYATTRTILSDTAKSPLDRVKSLVAWASAEAHLEPPTEDPLLWKHVELVAYAFCDNAESPNGFDPSHFPSLFKPVRKSDVAIGTENVQKFYIRCYERRRGQAEKEYQRYMQKQPIDAAFATAKLAAHGMADTANFVLKNVLSICGFEGAAYKVHNVQTGTLERIVRCKYGGTTSEGVADRHAHDSSAQPQSRLTHFLSVVDNEAVQLFEICVWHIPIENSLDWRTKALLSDLERILVFLLGLNLNSAPGGFIPRYRLPSDVREACERVTASLPPPVAGVPNLELSRSLEAQIDKEAEFLQSMRNQGYDAGPTIDPNAFEGVKQNLSAFLQIINDFVVSLWILKDITRESFIGTIGPGFFPEDMGYSMALLWDTFNVIYSYKGLELLPDLRSCLGPFIDIWRLILIHRYWGLMIMMLLFILEQLNPLLIIGFSAPVAHMFLRSTLLQLSKDPGIEGQLCQAILLHPRIRSLQSPPTFPEFQDHVGRFHIVSSGPDPKQLALYLSVIHPGRSRYRPWVLLHLLRVGFLVTFKGVVAQRVVAHLAATSPPTDNEVSRRNFLVKASRSIEERLEKEGLETLLDQWLRMMQDAESADTALRGKHVVHGELVRWNTGKPRCYANRDTGTVARGEPHSPERFAQLRELVQTAETDMKNGLPTFTGPLGSTPLDGIFSEWLLTRQKGVSLLWSANRHGRTPDAFKAIENEKHRLAIYNKVLALDQRRAAAEKYGGYRRSIFVVRTEKAAVDILRGRISNFSQAIVEAVCNECGEGDIGFDQNTQHRCKIEHMEKDAKWIKLGARGAEAKFHQYLRLLYFHDLMNHPVSLNYLNDEDLTEMGIFSVPAMDFLVDTKGEPLPSLPSGIDVATAGEEVIWRREDTPPHVLLASALDVAARTTAEHHDATTSGRRRLMIGSIYAPAQDKLWADNFGECLTTAIRSNPNNVLVCHHTNHDCLNFSIRSSTAIPSQQVAHSCTRGKGAVDYQQFVYGANINASAFTQLPYAIQRVCIYKAIIERDEAFQKILMW